MAPASPPSLRPCEQIIIVISAIHTYILMRISILEYANNLLIFDLQSRRGKEIIEKHDKYIYIYIYIYRDR